MKSLVTTQHGQVLIANGEIAVEINGERRLIAPGEQLPVGTTLFIPEDAELEIAYEDGATFSSAAAQDETSEIADADTSITDEIQAIQAQIAAGEDPTEGPDTAAGAGANGNEGGDFVSLGRSGDETLAGSGFDTSFGAPLDANAALTANLSLAQTDNQITDNVNIAQFTDNFVNGVAYTTSSGLSGFTGDVGADGSFAYNPGDTITFSIGDVIIASFSADAIQGTILFLQDIAGTSLSDSNMNYVENMAIFLQALDNDLSDGTDDGVLQTNSIVNLDDSYASNINIIAAIHEALTGYVDPTTGQPLNLATAGKEMLSLVLAELGIIFTRDSELDPSGANIFETLAMDHVADTIDDLAGDRGPVTADDRTADILDVPGGLITYNYNELDGKITFTANDLLAGASGQQVTTENLVVKNVQLNADFADIGTLVDLGNGNYEIILNAGITQYDLEGLSIDYRVEDWTAFREVTSATQDQFKSHLSADIPDVFEHDGFNQFTLNSELTFADDQLLEINFTSEIMSEQLGFPIAEYADDYLVPLEYSNDGGLTWQTMTVTSVDYSGSIPRPVFGFVLEAGNDSVIIRVPIFDDVAIEPTEYFVAQVTGENVYDETLQFAIFDNDADGSGLPQIDIDYVIVIEGMENAVFTLTLSEASTETITVNYSTEELSALFGEDFIAVSGTVTFLPGETTAYITVPIVDDLIIEDSPEFAIVNLTDPVNAALVDAQGTLRIFDNDGPSNTAVSIDIDPITGDNLITDAEGNQTITVTGTVSADASITVGIVIITINGQTYQTEMNADGTFSIEVAGSELVNDPDTVIEAVVYGFGAGGAQGTANTSENYDVESILADDTNTIDEDGVATGNVLDNDSDIDDDLSVVSFEVDGENYTAGTTIQLEGGSLVINEDGTYTFAPNENWNGTVPVITYTTNTGSTATLTLNVIAVDDPSIVNNDSNTINEGETATGNVLDNDSDVDDDLTVVSFQIDGITYDAGVFVSVEGGFVVINEDGSYSFTPESNWNGTLPVITYTTNTGSTATLTLEVTPVDDPSVLANDSNTINEDSVATGNVLDNDSDIDNDLSVVSFEVNGETHTAGTTVQLEGGTLVINEDGTYTFTPNENWNGSVPVITYTTNTDSSATLTLEVTPVNDPSVLANDSNTIDEDSVATGNVLDNDSDIDNDLSVVSFELNGETHTAGTTVELEGGTLVINEDGTYTFTPNENWNGSVPVITYTTNTGSTATLTLEVTPVDDPSVLANDSNTIDEDSVATGNVLDNDSDIDNNLSVVSFEVNGETHTAGTTVQLEGGTLVINEDGTYTFTPNENWNGSVPVITYTTNTDSTATLTLEVTPVNDPSVLANDSKTIDEDTVATGNVLDNDVDVDDALSVVSFTVEGSNAVYQTGEGVELTSGTLELNADGSYTFTPWENWNGDVPVITYTTNTGESATLTIVVNDDNTDTANDTNSVNEEVTATGNILTNDESENTEVVSFTIGDDPTVYLAGEGMELFSGVFSMEADGSYSFMPWDNWNGVAPIVTYTTNTGETATLTITVTPENDAPVLVADISDVDENATLTVNTDNGVLSNDTDVDSSDELTVTGILSGTTGAATTVADGAAGIVVNEYGTLTMNADGSYSFVANGVLAEALAAGTTADVTFTYTATDGVESLTQTLTITITGANDPADITVGQGDSDAGTVTEDGATDTDVDTVEMVSGSLTVTDVDSGEAVFQVQSDVADGNYGSFSIDADGNWTYTLNNDHADVQSLTDGQTLTRTITVTSADGTASHNVIITIVGANDPADITVGQGDSDAGTVTEDGATDTDAVTVEMVSGSLTVTDVDSGEAVFQVQSDVADGNYGSFSIDADGNWTYTLNNDHADVQSLTDGQTLTRTITVTSADGTASHNVIITIVGANDPADITVGQGDSDAGTVTEDGLTDSDVDTVEMVSGSLTVTDVDTGEAVFQVQSDVADGNYGSFSIDADGNWTYTLNNDHADVQSLTDGQTLTRTITVTSADGTASHNVIITIVGANDPADITVGQGDSDAGTVTEDGATDTDAVTVEMVSGSLTVTDVDTGEAVFQVQSDVADGNYGSFSIDADGNWTYTLNNDHADVQSLTDGQTLTRTITVTSADGTASHNVIITIVG
ncbi:retention module-containing protein, partial [Shewanella sp. YLB-07]|uniref:retention module-containing protein n=1 Tax=Shewanella sp. YLB-07 TaxID=2601268 RepID=UPI00128B12E9